MHVVADEARRALDEVGAMHESIFEIDLVSVGYGDAVGDDDHRKLLGGMSAFFPNGRSNEKRALTGAGDLVVREFLSDF
jgi:hypothetical protein